MAELVVGFVIADDGAPHRRHVLLLKKPTCRCEPAFAGLWNGPGGIVEPGESPAEAMSRELLEEVGLKVPREWWVGRVRLLSREHVVHVLAAVVNRTTPLPAYEGPEVAEWFPVADLGRLRDAVPDLSWLVGVCLDHRVSGPGGSVNVRIGEWGERTKVVDLTPRRW